MVAGAFKSIFKLAACALVLFSVASRVQAQNSDRVGSGKAQESNQKTGDAAPAAGKTSQQIKDSTPAQPASRFRKQEIKTEEPTERVDLNTPIKSAVPKIDARTLKDDSRDPFRPATLRKKVIARPRENLSPLERFELNQLKIVGIVWDMNEPRAMVEDGAGLGYTIKHGAPIGANDGVVKTIHRNEIIVEEYYYDVYGARKKREVSMKLSTE
jgi:type IV pilus assembly protein PilP